MKSNFVLEFHEDALILSGTTGTKLKSSIIGKYYPLWWSITSGGPSRNFQLPTSIIEVNAGTGEDFVEETKETILASSGHCLQLKLKNANTSNLVLVLIESHDGCYYHLKQVVKKIQSDFALVESEGPPSQNRSGIYLLNRDLRQSIDLFGQLNLGNSLFFFDPLLYTPWLEIERVAQSRIKTYYRTGTEFIVFLFTSDWFLGRKEMVPLPKDPDPKAWSNSESATVTKMDELFGNRDWRPHLLRTSTADELLVQLVSLYKSRLHNWFRYVLPLPFEPKIGQTYHLFVCSNYEAGIRITRDFYTASTGNPRYSPDNKIAYMKFRTLHPENERSSTTRSAEWKMLWKIVRDHEEGLCDIECDDLVRIEPITKKRKASLDWLVSKGYLVPTSNITERWLVKPTLYKVEWQSLQTHFGITRPLPLEPMRPSQFTDQARKLSV